MVQGCDGRDQLHGGGGAHAVTVVVAVEGRVGREVPHHEAQLGGLQQWVGQQRVQSCLHVLRPWQMGRNAVGQCHGVFKDVVFVFVELSPDGGDEAQE